MREGSRDKMEDRIAGWGAQERVGIVTGDLGESLLGVPEAWIEQHRGKVDHFFHLAAIYDMTVSDERNEVLNVGGTRHAVALGNALEAGTFHHVSSVAVAGDYKGLFREDMFNEGQGLPSAYHRTKFESEKVARESLKVPWRIYRPAIVVGHSRTGQMDKIDGPYYFFKAIQKARAALPEWFPLVGPELGRTNVVPVDYVADALDHIAHQPELDGQTFHLASPRMQRSGEVLNTFARAAHAPQLALRVDKRLTDALPKGVFSMLMKLPALKDVRKTLLADVGIPDEVIEHVGFRAQFDTRDTERALAGVGHRGARARRVRLAAVGPLGAPPRPRPLPRPLVRGRDQRADRRHHRRLERDRARRRPQDRRRGRDPDPRGAVAGQARGRQGRDRGGRWHGLRLLRRPLRLRRDRRARRAPPGRPRGDRHARQQRRAVHPPVGRR